MGYLSRKIEESCNFFHWKKKLKKAHPNRPSELTEFSYSQLHAATNGFSKHNLLGQGSHGFVYKAQLLNGRKSFVAAVKINKQSEINGGAAAENELRILSRVYQLRLVNLLGYGLDTAKNILTVVEFMPNGSLYELLHCSTRPPVIHRDIKSSNALIDEKLHARLGDFGLALMGMSAPPPPPAGTLGYLDPGYLAPGDVSTKCDVFSFGILLLEIMTGRNAIDVKYSPPSVMDWAVPLINSGDYAEIFDPRIGTPENCSSLRQLAEVAARCVTKAAAERPTMAEVVRCLKAVYKRVRIPPIRWRVNCMREPSRVDKHELLDDSKEMVKISMVGSRRTRKVSNVSTVELDNNMNG
ncbi:serine/threonine-protein kinase-like protein At1g28390 isoform X2 [Ipomoea triloba]|uniref:serine/threonine-protein kinase-like protein At1g28390 isoform X2 n=1 Tax=Ipomoea triloba TaxID=35885 RepID=UPI00125E61DB|nr:serine/threonine-protein kinase-like protein At1g28390 isoform X2 [Ipomoea triloba]